MMSTPASAASSIASCGCGVCWKPSTVAFGATANTLNEIAVPCPFVSLVGLGAEAVGVGT